MSNVTPTRRMDTLSKEQFKEASKNIGRDENVIRTPIVEEEKYTEFVKKTSKYTVENTETQVYVVDTLNLFRTSYFRSCFDERPPIYHKFMYRKETNSNSEWKTMRNDYKYEYIHMCAFIVIFSCVFIHKHYVEAENTSRRLVIDMVTKIPFGTFKTSEGNMCDHAIKTSESIIYDNKDIQNTITICELLDVLNASSDIIKDYITKIVDEQRIRENLEPLVLISVALPEKYTRDYNHIKDIDDLLAIKKCMAYRKMYRSSQLLTCDTFLSNTPKRQRVPKKKDITRESMALVPVYNSPDGPVLELKIPYVDIAELVFSTHNPKLVETYRHLSRLFYERGRIMHGILITPRTLFGDDHDHMSIMNLLLHQSTCSNIDVHFNDINGNEVSFPMEELIFSTALASRVSDYTHIWYGFQGLNKPPGSEIINVISAETCAEHVKTYNNHSKGVKYFVDILKFYMNNGVL